ncbi:hypothetical protein FRB95_007498 [Tulasnella sp. JGI-2019a]|nr:hypothetical protein FRB95_007498 [Tulasnella sp. JGI-2019a]
MARWNAHPDLLAERASAAVHRFNHEQRAIFDRIMEAANNNQPLCLFIDGKAGRGKTFLLNAICDALRSINQIVIPTATSAFAAQLYPDGRTAHSAFKIPVNEFSEMLLSPIEASHSRGELLHATCLFVWDEVPMANRAAVACVDELLRRLTGQDLPFGGKILIFVGDFRQTCPVVRRGTRAQVIDASIRSSALWDIMEVSTLTIPIHNAQDPEYTLFVDAIGDGMGPDVPLPYFMQVTTSQSDLINFTFPPHILCDPESSAHRSILAPTNNQVDSYNSTVLHRMEGVARTYLAADELKELADVSSIPQEAAHAILDYVARRPPPGIPAHSLTVKVGAVYRLLRNLSVERGLAKNIRGVVQSVGHRVIAMRMLRQEGAVPNDDSIVLLPRIAFEHNLHSGHTLVRRQFPIAPAYATTFNSCQGLTLDRVGVDATKPVFSHGQLYTALSKVRSRNDIVIRTLPGQFTVKNVTYEQILL